MTSPAAGRRSAIYVGHVRHRRHRPRPYALRHASYWVLLDVDELPELDRTVRGFGYRRRAVASFLDTDHLGDHDLPVRTKLARWLADRGASLPAGRVEVLTNLRVLGHVFNPVAWWFCRDRDDRVVLVVAEVGNTFGESHAYLLDRLEARPDATLRDEDEKVFHVSPFLPIEGHRYAFTFTAPDQRVLAHIDVHDQDGRVLDATQTGRRVPLTSTSLARVQLRHPLVTVHTLVRIHVHAARLWWRRTPFHRKPRPPDDGYADLDVARVEPAARAPQEIAS